MATNLQIEIPGNRMDFDYSRGVTGYVLVLTRLITGYWFFHAGVTKIVDEPFSAAGCLMNAPAASPLRGFFAWVATAPWLLDFTNVMVPWGESLIGLRLTVGAFVRLAASFGGVLMVFPYLGSAEWGHGVVNGDLFGPMMFVIVGTLAAGRIFGLDVIIEKMELVRQRPTLEYLLG